MSAAFCRGEAQQKILLARSETFLLVDILPVSTI